MKIKKKLIMKGIIALCIIALIFTFFNIGNDIYIKAKVKNGVAGLRLNEVHSKGYTGRGVNVAIIDSWILKNHDEFKDCLKHYEEVGQAFSGESHGTEVTSVLCGKNCGVVPKCNLYYFAINIGDRSAYIKAINKIMQYNANVNNNKKIRIVNISSGCQRGEKGAQEFDKAVEYANKNGILVFTSTVPTFTKPGFAIRAAYFEKHKDINDFNNIDIYMDKSKLPNDMTKEKLINTRKDYDKENNWTTVYIPSGNRYVASYENSHNYIFEKECSDSLATPYFTGLAVLALQANPSLTNKEILNVLSKSTVKNKYELSIISPTSVIKNAQEIKNKTFKK